ncbi:hypothetical protein WMF26_06420 [Sorangium sp. So ce185]|uniref:hypothetical protein n=1 Tax=Sorangium sp. So ce185 TaxID=3133287 RepID=UPI003F612E2B
MHIYWTEITITDADAGTSVAGNEARNKVSTELSRPRDHKGLLIVGGDGETKPASVVYHGKTVSSELLLIVLRSIAAGLGKNWRFVYKESRSVKRVTEIYDRYKAEAHAEREGQNALRRPIPPYVIIGDGTAATVDHTTLRQSAWGKARVAPAEILHVGFEDPWSHYNQHKMGQFPQLLGLPGLAQRPALGGPNEDGKEDVTGPRDSTRFAADTRAERARLAEHVRANKRLLIATAYGPAVRPLELLRLAMCVLAIVPRGTTALHDSARGAILREGIDEGELDFMLRWPHPRDFPRYRLLLADTTAHLHWLYADKIDICTGAGKPRAVDETMVTSELYEAVRTRLWEPVERWDDAKKRRAILSGTEGLYRETDWSVGERYCVMGGGGVGVNMVERAEETDKWVDWLATKTLHESFPIGRNDILLKHPADSASERRGQPMRMDDFAYGRNDQLAVILPAEPKWRFGQGCDLDRVEEAAPRLRVTFKQSPDAKYDKVPNAPEMSKQPIPALIRDYDEQVSDLEGGAFKFYDSYARPQAIQDPRSYDRVIRCAGQDIREVGQAEKIAAMLELVPLVSPADGRMVGLQTKDESVRVLGAAATGNAALVSAEDAAVKKMRAYHETLPAQGRIIFVGFVFSALNVAEANHYFDPGNGKAPNTNVNTMSQKELEALLGDVDLARRIIEVRKKTQSGYVTIAELKKALVRHALGQAEPLPEGWEGKYDGWKSFDKTLNKQPHNIAKQVGDDEVLAGKIADARDAVRRTDGALFDDVWKNREALKAKIKGELTKVAEFARTGWKPSWDAPIAKLTAQYRPADELVY